MVIENRVWLNRDCNRRRYHTTLECHLQRESMDTGDRGELDRRGYTRCSYCRKLDGEGPSHIQEFLESANPEDIGLSKAGERNV